MGPTLGGLIVNAHTPITIAEPALEATNEGLHAALCRSIENAPVENKLKLFHLLSRTAADELKQRKLQFIDDLWFVAEELGLVRTFGITALQESLSDAFEREGVYR
jgi:hypothetical protein